MLPQVHAQPQHTFQLEPFDVEQLVALEKTLFCVSAVRGYSPPLQNHREVHDGRQGSMWMASVTSEGIEFWGLWKFSLEEAKSSALRTWLDAHIHDQQIMETFERQRFYRWPKGNSRRNGANTASWPPAPTTGHMHGYGPRPHMLSASGGPAGMRPPPPPHVPPPYSPTQLPAFSGGDMHVGAQVGPSGGAGFGCGMRPSAGAPFLQVCRGFLNGTCRHGPNCRFAHILPEEIMAAPSPGGLPPSGGPPNAPGHHIGPHGAPPPYQGGAPPLGPTGQAPFGVQTAHPPSIGVGLRNADPQRNAPVFIPLTTAQRSGMSLDTLIEIRRASRAKIELKQSGVGLGSSSIQIVGSPHAVEAAIPLVYATIASAGEAWSRRTSGSASISSNASRRPSCEEATPYAAGDTDATSRRASADEGLRAGEGDHVLHPSAPPAKRTDYWQAKEADELAEAAEAPVALPTVALGGAAAGGVATETSPAHPRTNGNGEWGSEASAVAPSVAAAGPATLHSAVAAPSTDPNGPVPSASGAAASTPTKAWAGAKGLCTCGSGRKFKQCCEAVISREMLSGLHVSRASAPEHEHGGWGGKGGKGGGIWSGKGASGKGAVGRGVGSGGGHLAAPAQIAPPAARWGIGAPPIVVRRDRADREGSGATTCVVCGKSPTDHAFVPCGHLCLCVDCGGNYLSAPEDHPWRLNGCPMCCDPYQTVMRIYKAGGQNGGWPT